MWVYEYTYIHTYTHNDLDKLSLSRVFRFNAAAVFLVQHRYVVTKETVRIRFKVVD